MCRREHPQNCWLAECWALCLSGRQLVLLYIPLIRVTNWLYRGLCVLWLFFLFYIFHQVVLAVLWHLVCELHFCNLFGLGYIIVVEISIFWDSTQRRLIVSYRYFGRTYVSRLQGSYFLGLLWPLKMGPMCVPKNRWITTIQRCVTTQKSEDLMYIVAEDWKHLYI